MALKKVQYQGTSMIIDGKLQVLGGLVSPSQKSIEATITAQAVTLAKAGGDAFAGIQNIYDMASDQVITPVEKTNIRREWNSMVSEYPMIAANLTKVSATTQLADYDRAYKQIQELLFGGVFAPEDPYYVPKPILEIMTANSEWPGLEDQIITLFAEYYYRRDDATLGLSRGMYAEYIFSRATTQPGRPAEYNPVDDVFWFDVPPFGSDQLWMSKAFKYGGASLVGQWSLPIGLEGAQGGIGPTGPDAIWLGDLSYFPVAHNNGEEFHHTINKRCYQFILGPNPIYPSDTLFPRDDLFPCASRWEITTVDPAVCITRYSELGIEWHSVYATGDLYLQTSTDLGLTWSAGVRFTGESEILSPVQEHTQLVANTIWNIQHNLGHYPFIVCHNAAGDEIKPTIYNATLNNATCVFSTAQAGTARIM